MVCNFTDREVPFTVPGEFAEAALLISNMENVYDRTDMNLKPYEAFVLKKSRF